MCVLSVLMAPSMCIRYNMGWYEMLLIDVPLFFAATASVANFSWSCQRELPPTGSRARGTCRSLMSIVIGLAVNNTGPCSRLSSTSRASSPVRQSTASRPRRTNGLARSTQSFVVQPDDRAGTRPYFTATVFYAWPWHLRHPAVPGPFQIGFLYTGLLSISIQMQAPSGSSRCLKRSTIPSFRPVRHCSSLTS